MPNLPSIPLPCTLLGGQTFDEHFELVRRSYKSGAPVYDLLVNHVLCFGVLYLREANDAEECQPCGIFQNPDSCATATRDDYFRHQEPLLNDADKNRHLVFQPFIAPGGPLNPEDAYNVSMLKVALVVEHDKLVEGWVNPLTGRPKETVRVDLSYPLPRANRPCDAGLGSCIFNNRQCDR